MVKAGRVRGLTQCGLFAALLAVCSWISIPTAVPVTLQTLGVFLAAGLLGGRLGTVSVGVFLLLGAVGLPVFSGFHGGVGALLGVTGGYLLGFLGTTLVMWAMEGLGERFRPLSMALGLLVCYAFGTAWFLWVYARQTGPVGLGTALGWCVLPFLPFDAVKLLLAEVLIRRLKGVLR